MKKHAIEYIDELTARGEISFTTDKMHAALDITEKAVERAIYRLKQKAEIVGIARGYYLILTPEFRKMGCLPPDYFIDDLMKFHQQKYYVGLTSAALYYGAAHQQPQIFQVITDQERRNIHCGSVRIEFIRKKNFTNQYCQKLKTETGTMEVSTPATTMMDLCIFLRQSGGVGHVATVLSELAHSVENTALEDLLMLNTEAAWVQRLGFLLQELEHNDLSEVLYKYIKTRKINTIPLVPYRTMTGTKRNKKWHIAINAAIESDVYDSEHCIRD